jgi:hypothetical protein
LKGFVTRLSLSLESFAISGTPAHKNQNDPRSDRPSATKELLSSEIVPDSLQPVIAWPQGLGQHEENPAKSYAYLIWKINIFTGMCQLLSTKRCVYRIRSSQDAPSETRHLFQAVSFASAC